MDILEDPVFGTSTKKDPGTRGLGAFNWDLCTVINTKTKFQNFEASFGTWVSLCRVAKYGVFRV